MKALKIIITIILLLFAFGINVCAQGDDVTVSAAEDIYDALDGETKDMLSSIGIDGAGFDQISDISPADIFNLIKNTLSGKTGGIAGSAAALAAVTAAVTAAQCFMPDDKKKNDMINTAAMIACAGIICPPVMSAVRGAAASIMTVCAFVKSLIPVMAGVMIASGRPAGAVSFEVFAFAAAQFISSAAGSYAVPVISSVISLDVAGAALPDNNLGGISSFIKKTLASAVSFVTVTYVSFLALKDILNDSADTLGVKSVKLLINSAVPVIGAPLSELYGSLASTASLVKSAAGIFAIIAIAVITLLPAADIILNIILLRAFGAVCGILNRGGISNMLDSVAGALTLMNVIMILNSALFIISIALLLNTGV